MKILVLLGFMAAPFVIGGLTAAYTDSGAGLCVVMFFSLLMMRESAQICLLLMRRWQMFEQEAAWSSLLPDHLIAAELRPVRVRSSGDVFRRDIYHRR